MKTVYLDSSLINSVSYDKETKVLQVTFNNNRSYEYLHVPKKIVTKLISSESAGMVFNEDIRDAFEYSELFEESK
jgi:hypothetical protein